MSIWSSRWLAAALALAFMLVFARPALAAAGEQAPMVSTMLSGKVSATSGEAMAGVTVSARMADSSITTSVFTDESGNYYFPPLDQGKYRVWAQAKGFEAAKAELDISHNKDTRQDFTLKSLPDYSLQLSTFEYLSAMDQTKADQRMAKVFSNLCASCHPGSFALQNRFDEKGWLEVLDRYKEGFGEDGPQTNSHHKHELIQHYKPELAAYLARMRGPGPSEMKLKLYPRPTGDAARVVITEYSIALPGTHQLADEDGSDWSQGIPSGYGTRGIHDVGIDSAGYAWFSDREMNRYRSYGKLDPKTGETTDFKVDGPRGMARMTHGLKADKDGVIWIELRDSPPTDHMHVLERIDSEAGAYTIFDPSSAGTGVLGNTIEPDGQGKIWTSATPGAYAFDPATKKFTYFQAPTKRVGGYGIAGDADGNGWFDHPKDDIVGVADYKAGTTSEIKLTISPDIAQLLTDEDRAFDKDVNLKSDSLEGKLTAVGPRRMSSHGNYVWWGNWFAGTLARADIHTHEVKYFDMPYPHLQAYGVQVDRDGNVWPYLMGNDLLARLEPDTGKWTTYPLPSLGYEIRYLAFDYRSGREEIWVPSNRASKIARLQFRTEGDFAAIHAKAGK